MTTDNKNFQTKDIRTNDFRETKGLRHKLASSFKRRVIFWVIRWTLGFGIIAGVVHVKPHLFWLWYVGAGTAGFALVMLILIELLIKKKR